MSLLHRQFGRKHLGVVEVIDLRSNQDRQIEREAEALGKIRDARAIEPLTQALKARDRRFKMPEREVCLIASGMSRWGERQASLSETHRKGG